MADRNPTTGISIALLVIAMLLTPMALWTSLWGGYGGSTGYVIAQWFAIIVLAVVAGGLALAPLRPVSNPAAGGSAGGEQVATAPVRRPVMPIVTGVYLLSTAVLEALVLVVNLPGGHLREALAIILAVLVVLGVLFLWWGRKRA